MYFSSFVIVYHILWVYCTSTAYYITEEGTTKVKVLLK